MTVHGEQSATVAVGWSVDEQPWVRRAAPAGFEALARAGGGARCYFCGQDSVKVSAGDLSQDTGRVQLYCDNPQCAAREMTVLVERDGVGAARRADVRALKVVDEPGLIDEQTLHSSGLVTRPPRPLPWPGTLDRSRAHEPLDLLIP